MKGMQKGTKSGPTRAAGKAQGSGRAMVKRSFSISRESQEFLERLKRERRAPSVSQVLEGILREFHRQEKRRALDAAITHYYDNLSDEQQREDRDWGELATGEFFEQN